MYNFPIVVLHRHKAQAVQRFHPWIFSGAIKFADKRLADGDTVEVQDEHGKFLAIGHWGKGSIAVRIFSFEQVEDFAEFWSAKFKAAYALRAAVGLTNNPATNAYRLICAEGDGLPGLIVDWYNGVAVVQCHSPGMNREKTHFVAALQQVYGEQLKAVYDKSQSALHQNENTPNRQTDGFLYGTADRAIITEHGHLFAVDFEQGQKTGFFVDQRENRQLLAQYAKDKTVLNTFCYSGGFSVYALKAGAALVHSVDSSAKATEWTDQNVALNELPSEKHQSFTSDVFDFMKANPDTYDVMILDPPAFAKSVSARHNALKAYKRLNLEAMKRIKPGGILFTFSCSQVVMPDLFEGAVTAAAIETGRKIAVLHRVFQPADHPTSIFHHEGLYLKGLVLHVA
jgi:23S rRNA (cytosine1962-C5)-methyltransferase